MEQRHKASMETVSWSEVRQDVARVLPQLALIIDSLNPGKRFPLYKVKYPFGAKIAHQGKLYLPTANGGFEAIDMGSNNKLLEHGRPPAALMLKNSAEMFYELPDRVISGFLMYPGRFIWLWEQFEKDDSDFVKWIWSLTSGARSLYMLPKITDVHEHKGLQRKYGIRSHAPKNLSEHWNIFREISTSQEFEKEWHSEILLFPHIWFETTKKDPAWRELHSYLSEIAWHASSYWRHKVTFELIWESFSYDVMDVNIKPNLYLACIVKQLILTGIGVLPGITVADDDLCGPISALKSAYTDVYKMRKYYPIFMRPNSFTFKDRQPTYYSLQHPNLLETIPVPRNLSSVLSAIPDIDKLLNEFREKMTGKWMVQDTPIDIFCRTVTCDYFHYRAESRNNIKSTDDIVKDDCRFSGHQQSHHGKVFPSSSALINGCIRFKNKEKTNNDNSKKRS